MMALEFQVLGKRNSPPPTLQPIAAHHNAELALALYLERHWFAGALIVACRGFKHTYAVCPRPSMPGDVQVVRVRIVEITDTVELGRAS